MSGDPIIAWLELEARLLKSKRPIESAFIAVNEAHAVAPYRQAILWNTVKGVTALSGGILPEEGTPYVLWLNQVMAALADKHSAPCEVTSADLAPTLTEQWAEWLPAYALFLPMADEALLYARDEPFAELETHLLERAADLVRLSRRALIPNTSLSDRLKWVKERKVRLAAAAALLIALFPVTGSILAPAEAVAAHPILVRAPLDGVVDHIHVKPNQEVAEGDVLFDLDSTTQTGKLDVARQQHATAEAEYRQAAQAMVFDVKAKTQVAILSSKAEEKAAEVKWLEAQLARITVKAPKAGIAVFDDPSEWIGKPVSVGEKIMSVTDETDTEIEAWLAVADVGEARPGAKLTLFLNTSPLTPLHATVRSVAYEASARPDATIAHRLRANLAEDGPPRPRLGLKGTARIDGETVPLVWWLFRHPLAIVRQTLGL